MLDYIRANDFSAISLQVALGRWDEWRTAVPQYAAAARDADSMLYLYEQGWGPDAALVIEDSPLLEIAVAENVPIVPCASAWARVRQENPDWLLHDQYCHEEDAEVKTDRVHPGLIGNYLNQACFVAAMSGESPVGKMATTINHSPRMADERSVLPEGFTRLGRVKYQFSDELATYLQQVAWDTVLAVRAKRDQWQ